MTTATIHVNATRAAVLAAVSGVPRAAAGGGGGSGKIVRETLRRAGNAILTRIRDAFIVKSTGGTDQSGDRWEPLAYSTVRRRVLKFRTRTEKKRPDFPSQALNSKQRDRWWELYRQGIDKYKKDKSAAAKYAWAMIKKEGAQTLVEKYGHKVEILRDTGMLLNSLSPEPGGKGAGMQIFRIERGAITVGTNRKGAKQHHEGNPQRGLPQRRLWPPPNNWPTNWWRDILDIVKQGIVDIVVESARNT